MWTAISISAAANGVPPQNIESVALQQKFIYFIVIETLHTEQPTQSPHVAGDFEYQFAFSRFDHL
jgi:hypothetical protein